MSEQLDVSIPYRFVGVATTWVKISVPRTSLDPYRSTIGAA